MKTKLFNNKLDLLQKLNDWVFDFINDDSSRLRDALLNDITVSNNSICGYSYSFEFSEKVDDNDYFYARFNVTSPFGNLLKTNLVLSHKGTNDIKRSITNNDMYLMKDDVMELSIYKLISEEICNA